MKVLEIGRNLSRYVPELPQGLVRFVPGWRKLLATAPHWAGGMLIAWAVVNFAAEPGVIVTDREEAEGLSFSDPGTLDIVSHAKRLRACPAQVQPYVWRWIDYKGSRAQQIIPLAPTVAPFLTDDGVAILSLPAGTVPDPEHGGWMYRQTKAEQCGFLPTWVSNIFGARLTRSSDFPVNFVGAPHTP